MKKILCIGEVLIDMICTDKGMALQHGNHFLKKAGGAPANVAAAIAALGGKVELAAKVGSDPFGDHLVEVLSSFGVDTKLLIRDRGNFTTFAFVSLLENGERDFYFNRGADGLLDISDMKTVDINNYSIMHFGSATAFLPGPLQLAYKFLHERSVANNLFISFDPNYRQLLFRDKQASFVRQSWHYIENCDFFKMSDEEALLITGCSTLDEAVEALSAKTPAVFAITLGKEGTLLVLHNEKIHVDSIPVNPVDTTGAGDAFVGAVLYQLQEHFQLRGQNHKGKDLTKDNWRQITSNANKAGARTCEYMGAMEAFRQLNNSIFR
ncbi:MAG TPA: carbohydrate kinase [Chitinophagaceae bacterium]